MEEVIIGLKNKSRAPINKRKSKIKEEVKEYIRQYRTKHIGVSNISANKAILQRIRNKRNK